MYVNDDAQIKDKIVIITGSNTGIGKATALQLAKRGGKIYFACRSKERGIKALNEIKEQSGNENLHFLKLDLNSLESVREFAKKFHELENRLDILINNAAVLMPPTEKTVDGFEKNMGVNHLGHFLLTHLLLDLLKASSPSRIVVVASDAHKYGNINKEDFNSEKQTGKGFSDSLKAYGTSKIANILFTRELSKRLNGTGIVVNTLCPGNVHTEATRYLGTVVHFLLSTLKKYFKKTPEEGCQTILMLSVDPFYADKSGDYYVDCVKTEPHIKAQDDEIAKWLWNKSLELTGLAQKDLFL